MQIRGSRLAARVETSSDPDLATAQTFLRANRSLLQLEDPDREVRLESRDADDLGYRHLKFQQRYRDLPVWPAEMIVHLNRHGEVSHFDGAYIATPSLLTDPIVTPATALKSARGEVAGGAAASAATPELIIYAPGDRTPRLAWRVEVNVSPLSRWLAVIDAVNGSSLTLIDEIMAGKATGSGRDIFGTTRTLNLWNDNGTYYLMDASKMMFDATSTPPNLDKSRGTITILDNKNNPPDSTGNFPNGFSYLTSTDPNSWALADGVSAAFLLSQTYDYYLERHARNSLDGKGGGLVAIVRVDNNFDNAYWNGTAMYFGDAKPWAGALDFVGHELTHGVTGATANLIYQNQAGALNEAMSDVFGQAVEARFRGGQIDWLMGDLLGPEPLRNMKNPGAVQFLGRGYPSTMSEYVVENDPILDNFRNKDNGGVHINSSIINHAFYYLVEGLPGAIGIGDSEKIFYRALTVHLLQSSQFLDARLACVQSAREIFGAGSNQARKTEEAFNAVEIYDTTAPPPPPPTVPTVNGADSLMFMAYRDKNNGFYLGRREAALGDPAQGILLDNARMSPFRPSVTGDGKVAFYVDPERDACFIDTNASSTAAPTCLGLPGKIFSVSMSPNGNLYGFVLLDSAGNPDNRIVVVNVATDTAVTYNLDAPAEDGPPARVAYATSMTFASSGRYLFYDALTELDLAGGTRIALWAIYAIDLSTGQTVTVVPPTPGYDISDPALGHTSDSLITFEVFNQSTKVSTVVAGNLETGDFNGVAIAANPAAPVFDGADTAIIYMVDDASTVSLERQGLGADHISPSGPPSSYLRDAAYGFIYRRGTYSGPQSNCVVSDTTLCLNSGRFQVTATWTTPQGQNGPGHAVRLTADTGYFWFFNSANVEVVLKTLNACGFSQRFWVFSGGLTNVAAVLTVTDTITGVTRTYSNKQGVAFQPILDTNAFATCFGPSATGTSTGDTEAITNFRDAAAILSVPVPNATCNPTSTSLCLNGGRFRVEAAWRTPQGQTGSGQAVALTPDTGYFWFFSDNNVELIVKTLNACSLSGRHWVFAGGLTNAEVTLRVTDTQTGTVKTYFSPLNAAFAPIQDTNAFATCP